MEQFLWREALPTLYLDLADQLVPSTTGITELLWKSELAAVVFERTALPPSEFERLSIPGRIPWLRRAIGQHPRGNGRQVHHKRPQAARKRAGRKPDADIAKRDDVWLVQYNAGLRSGEFETEADFARHVGEDYDLVRKALQRASKRQRTR